MTKYPYLKAVHGHPGDDDYDGPEYLSQHTTTTWEGPIEHKVTVVEEEPIYHHVHTHDHVVDEP